MSTKQTIIVDGVTYHREPDPADAPLVIVVADRGWVFVGHSQVAADGSHCIRDARGVRRWGTTRGLAELATGGPTEDTVLDHPCPVTIPSRAVLAVLECSEGAWL